MPSFLRPASGLLLAAVALALAVCWTALAGPPGGVEISVKQPDGTTKSILANEVAPDIDGPYTVRQANGATSRIDVVDGVSIRALLVATQSELGYVSVEIAAPNGRTIKLTRDQIDAATPRPPVLYSDETGATWFLRSPSSETDANALDHFSVDGSVLAIEQLDDELDVKLTASKRKIEPGDSVTFEASASPESAGYRYNWTFEPGVGKDDAGATVRHRFKKEGSYKVVVGVYQGSDEASSGSDNVRIQVGDPKQSDKDREGGGENGGSGAPDSGSSTGSTDGGSSYDDGSSGYTPYTPAPSPPTPTPPAPAPPPSPEPLTPDIGTSGPTVEGNLLADASDPPPSSLLESAARAARDGKPKAGDAADGAGVSEAALGVAGVLALLGLGAGIESRQGRLPRLRLPRRAA